MSVAIRVSGLFAMLLAWVICPSNAVSANPWSSSIGEAKAVQCRTEDIAKRLNRSYPYSVATQPALLLDNSACQLVELLRCGAPWSQVQLSMQQTCELSHQVGALVASDCRTRDDASLRIFRESLDRRLGRLDKSVCKNLAKIRCAPFGYSDVFPAPAFSTKPVTRSPDDQPHFSGGLSGVRPSWGLNSAARPRWSDIPEIEPAPPIEQWDPGTDSYPGRGVQPLWSPPPPQTLGLPTQPQSSPRSLGRQLLSIGLQELVNRL